MAQQQSKKISGNPKNPKNLKNPKSKMLWSGKPPKAKFWISRGIFASEGSNFRFPKEFVVSEIRILDFPWNLWF